MEPRLLLRRVTTGKGGAFGTLIDLKDGYPFAVTLERTYVTYRYETDERRSTAEKPVGHEVRSFAPKIPADTLECRRSYYHKGDYPTFEIMVPSHTRILFHKGNMPTDSDGCVLVGETFSAYGGRPGIGSSSVGFSELMFRLHGLSRFVMVVEDALGWHGPAEE